MGWLSAREEKKKITVSPLLFGGAQTQEMEMDITANKVKDIIGKLEKISPKKPVLDGTRRLSLKEAIAAMAPTIKKMYDRGFGTDEIVQVLKGHDIEIKAQTLRKYMRGLMEPADSSSDPDKPIQPKTAHQRTEPSPVIPGINNPVKFNS